MEVGTILEKIINQALDELYKRDRYLIEHEVNEQAIVFRFAHYLQNIMYMYDEFVEYDLDVEYNRNGNSPKHISIREKGAKPDLIIHKRGSNKKNLLIIEFKTSWRKNTEDDRKKLKCFVNPRGTYRYAIGLSVVFGKKRDMVRIENVLK